MSTTLYTIGHSNHSFDRFAALLSDRGIECVVDVRSRPYSRWVPHFCKRRLQTALRVAGLHYEFLGQALGGLPRGERAAGMSRRLDYAQRCRAPDFIAGIERLVEIAARRPTAIMCAEEDPSRCHRRLLVTPELRGREVEVVHIRGDGRIEPESSILDAAAQLSLL